MIQSLWRNLRRSMQSSTKNSAKNGKRGSSATTTGGAEETDEGAVKSVFNFPYGNRELVVSKRKVLSWPRPPQQRVEMSSQASSPQATASSPTYSPTINSSASSIQELAEDLHEEICMNACQRCGGRNDNFIEIRSRPSGRYGMFRDLWALRLAAFGTLNRNAGAPFSTATTGPSGAGDSSRCGELPSERSMKDSLIQVTLPFKDNKELFSDYMNVFGGIRFGKIMEDLDVFAATCAYMHCGTNSVEGQKLAIVTAAVDRIDVHMRLDEPLNLRMKGMVTFVGKSSMEVTIVVESSDRTRVTANDVDQVVENVVIDQLMREKDSEEATSTSCSSWKTAAIAKFIMVARDSRGPVAVPRLKLTSPREEAIFAAGSERHAARLTRTQQSLFKEPPTAAESALLHAMFLESIEQASQAGGPEPQGPQSSKPKLTAVSITETTLTTTKLCHPQERNIHDLIFGGYLMREAFELGFLCGQMFARSDLYFLAVDELAFKHPVPIGAVLQLTAQVIFSLEENGATSQLIHVEVVADVINVQSSERKTTNTFHFTFRSPQPSRLSIKPATYSEAMKYLEGKRRISAAPLDPRGTIYRF